MVHYARLRRGWMDLAAGSVSPAVPQRLCTAAGCCWGRCGGDATHALFWQQSMIRKLKLQHQQIGLPFPSCRSWGWTPPAAW